MTFLDVLGVILGILIAIGGLMLLIAANGYRSIADVVASDENQEDESTKLKHYWKIVIIRVWGLRVLGILVIIGGGAVMLALNLA